MLLSVKCIMQVDWALTNAGPHNNNSCTIVLVPWYRISEGVNSRFL